MNTAARVTKTDSSHWYHPDGRPCYEVLRADRSGMRPTTLGDARKLGLLPSVTTILQVLNKPGLNSWKEEQAVLAAITTPRLKGEADDAFIERVLHVERHQDQEAAQARELGTDIHNALETLFAGGRIDYELEPWVLPAYHAVASRGKVLAIEKCLVGDGYAGKTDLILDCGHVEVIDWKTAKSLPVKGAWSEHRLQAGAYANAYNMEAEGAKPIRTLNVYISTQEMGLFVVAEHEAWEPTYEQGFKPLVTHWQWATGYKPQDVTSFQRRRAA